MMARAHTEGAEAADGLGKPEGSRFMATEGGSPSRAGEHCSHIGNRSLSSSLLRTSSKRPCYLHPHWNSDVGTREIIYQARLLLTPKETEKSQIQKESYPYSILKHVPLHPEASNCKQKRFLQREQNQEINILEKPIPWHTDNSRNKNCPYLHESILGFSISCKCCCCF